MTSIDPVSHEAQLYADAIMEELNRIADGLGRGEMNAVLGALVSCLARFIAGVDDPRIRKNLQDQIAKMLDRQITRQIEAGETSRVQLIIRKAN